MLTERQEVDKIEVVGQYRYVQVRTATVISRAGVEVSRSFHRHAVAPGQDFSGEDEAVAAVCAAVHTPSVIAAYQEHLESSNA